jgi:hypothetical protein
MWDRVFGIDLKSIFFGVRVDCGIIDEDVGASALTSQSCRARRSTRITE